MNTTTATITSGSLVVEQHDYLLDRAELWAEARPASFKEADRALAYHSLARTGAWELTADGNVTATVGKVDNRFNGTVAARLWDAVGTTHGEFETAFAHEANNGDLISDMEICKVYVVAAERREGDTKRIHMVGECKTWEDRYTTDFHAFATVKLARRK